MEIFIGISLVALALAGIIQLIHAAKYVYRRIRRR